MKAVLGLLALMVGLSPMSAQGQDLAAGLVRVESTYSVAETVSRFESVLEERGLTLFTTVDHAMGAESVDLELRPTQLILFGNPRVGTPLMQCRQSVAIDLPQKALVWEDAEGSVWIGYNDPTYLDTRHDLAGCEETLDMVTRALNSLAEAAAQSE